MLAFIRNAKILFTLIDIWQSRDPKHDLEIDGECKMVVGAYVHLFYTGLLLVLYC